MRSQVYAPRPCAVRLVLGASVFVAALLPAPAVVMAETRLPQPLPQILPQGSSPQGSSPQVSSPQVTARATSSITVEGNRRVEADTIRSYFHVRPGGQLDAAVLD